MLKKVNSILIAISFICLSFEIQAESKYEIVADASVPQITTSLKGMCKFMDEVSSGSSLILTGAVVALAFSLKKVSISSDLRVLLYAKKDHSPQIAFIAKSVKDIPDKVKFNKHKFPCKAIGDRLFIAETEELLNSINKLPPKDQSEKVLTVKLFPEKYFTDCSGTIEAFKAKIDKEFSKGRKSHDVKIKGDAKVLEQLLRQLKQADIVVKANAENFSVDLTVFPKQDSEVQKILLSHKGIITQDELIELAQKVSDAPDFKIFDEIKASLIFLLNKIFKESDTDAIADKLCKFKIFSDNKKMTITISITPKLTRDILIATDVLKKVEDKEKRKKIKF